MVLALLLAPAAGAQLAGQGQDRLPLTDEAPPEADTDGGLPCGDVEVHGIAPPGESSDQAGEADLSRSSAVLGCPTLFRTTVSGAFNVTREAGADLFVGCSQPAVMHQPLNNVRVWLIRNGEAIAEGGDSLPATCTPGEPMELSVAIPQPEDPSFNASDVLGLNVTVFGSPNFALDNLHLVVGGNETPSTLTLPGVSEAFAPDEEPEPETVADNETEEANRSDLGRQSTDAREDTDGVPGPGTIGSLAVLAIGAVAVRRR